MGDRTALVERKTQETDIKISLNLDGTGKSNVSTGIGFFDHMLRGFAKHGFFDLDVTVKGDTEVDGHHTVEDTLNAARENRFILSILSCLLIAFLCILMY